MPTKPFNSRNRLLIVLVLLLSLSGCSKTDDGDSGSGTGEYYIRFKMNGVQNEYRAGVLGRFNKADGATDYLSMFGGSKVENSQEKNTMVMMCTTLGKASLNTTYTNYKTSAAGFKKAELLTIGLKDENGNSSSSWSDDLVLATPAGTETKAQLMVTEANSTYIKGTFSCVLYSSGFTNKYTVTDGEFYLKPQ